MSRRVVATDFGGPENLLLVDVDVPEPGPGQVRVAVRAAGVNPVDVKSYSGAFGTDPAQLPKPLGSEASGTVTAVGNDVDVRVGDEVAVFRAPGAYATDLLVEADAVVAKPAEVDWADAAGLLLTGSTAVHALTATDVAEGETVLVHGGSGGVGLMAVQLAAGRGARVIATASERNHALLRELGAEPVVYGAGLLERVRGLAPDGVHAALDLIGTDEALEVSLALVENRSRIATIVNFEGGGDAGIKVLGGGPGADPGDELRQAARPDLLAMVARGELRVLVEATYPLAEAGEAHQRIAGGHVTGKLVLLP